MIEQACKEMEAGGNIKIKRTSALWETPAMYVVDQDKFVNGACEIETTLSPIELLDELQAVENRMGRVKVIDKGPRNIDLDVLLYDNITYKDERLQVPHLLMREREFVLRPLCQIFNGNETNREPFEERLTDLLNKLPTTEQPLSTITPLTQELTPIQALRQERSTHVMSILNVTPDSFSDGGQNYNIDTTALANTIKSHIAAGATIIDVGGQSTRPGAVQIPAEQELARILPAIELIRSLPEAKNVAISIDTYHASVAEATINAGAHVINDISAGLLDKDMLPTVARLGCTICLMHMRGTPETMNSQTHYPNGVVADVGAELLSRIHAAEASGIRRWRIILDPGIGFAKTLEQNLDLLRGQDELRRTPGLEGIPWLVGTSRKAFKIGRAHV